MEQPLLQKEVFAAGVRLRYLEREADGTESKAPLLLLHALLATAASLTELISYLPRDRRIVALDLPSAELETNGKTAAVDFTSLSELICKFIDAVDLDQPVAVGHSHGGALALRIAASHPALLRALILLSPAHPFSGYRLKVVNFYLTRHGRALALCIPLAPEFMIRWAYNQAAGPSSRISREHLRPHLPVLRNRNSLRRVLQILKTWEADMECMRQDLLAAALKNMPTLLIWGDSDPVVPITSADGLKASLGQYDDATLAGKGHLLAEEAPEECGQLISDWVERLDPGHS